MKKYIWACLGSWIACFFLNAQEIGSWKTYLSYYTTTAVAEGNDYVFAVANGSLYRYGKEDNSLYFYSPQTGLNDNGISHIGYNPEVHTLVIVYGQNANGSKSGNNGNIDLLSENGIYNLPYLKNNTHLQDKTVYDISFYKEYAYLSTAFGILVIDLKEREIKDTYKLDKTVYATCIRGNELYAATEKGIWRGSINDNLLDPHNWSLYSINAGVDASPVSSLGVFCDRLCWLIKGKGLFYQESDGSMKNLSTDSNLSDFSIQNDRLIAWTTENLSVYASLTDKLQVNLKTLGTIESVSSSKDNRTYWIATGENGLKAIQLKGNNQAEVVVTDLFEKEDFPKRNLDYCMLMDRGRLFVTGGGRWTERYNYAGTLMIHENGKWMNFNEREAINPTGSPAKDYVGVAVDPADPTHYFVSSYGEGLLEFKDNQYHQLYTFQNSSLETIYAGNYNYIRVSGIAFDPQGNLWMTNCKVRYAVKVLTPEGKWVNMPYTDQLNAVEMLDKIWIASDGNKWINIPYGVSKGVFVFNEKGTIEDTSDDAYHYYSSFYRRNGEQIDASYFYSLTEDKNGDIWIGTNKGILVCPAAVARRAAVDPSAVYCTQITRYNEEGNAENYFLDGEKITAIQVDGGNRKWIGTESSGVFLVNGDGSETLQHFTTLNSPLLSDNILSIALNETNGEVFFGTDKGLISYMGGATKGEESYSDVYAFPNPVRPEFTDQVTITGLMTDSNVKITDLNGHLVYQGKSEGGQLTWNCRDGKGQRVATGIYLVLAATPEAKESVVTKIMVIK